ncbi:MAG: DUF503 domain-containing protein [Candidatus Omnitrophota bacterium]
MLIGIAKILILIPSSSSLKEKRMVLRSLKNKLRSSFNISIIELDDHEKWQKTTLALATIGTESKQINSLISHTVNYLENYKHIQLLDYETELI